MMQVWGVLAIFIFCPLLGGLPLIAWITRALTGRRLGRLGTGNISVSAAFYHGGKLAGILAVLSEALKGIAAVLLARTFFPTEPAWELIALIALVMGRYWMGKGAGTTNVVWGYVVHDWRVALLVFLIGGISFTVFREKELGRFGVLFLFPTITALLHVNDSGRIMAAIALAILIGWIYKKIPDDLDLSPTAGQAGSQKMFRFFRGDKAIVSLDDRLEPQKVGDKAATLSQLKSWGYPVPMGWVLVPGDDPEPLIQALQPSTTEPLVVRSSAVGEDSAQAAAAGQYETVLQVTSRAMLRQAIARIQASYDLPNAVEYRRSRGQTDAAMAVLIQTQVQGVFSGVAFSRDPITQQGDAVAVEALPGEAQQVVSGRVTPEQYRVVITDVEAIDTASLQTEGAGDVPPELIKQVAFLARKLESQYHGIPQDIEWSYDGSQLWLLQSRPITTLLPIWTRKIAAEVIPGAIRPLTWSINRPLTCSVWGEIFTIVLGDRSQGLDFNETATLHHARAYFNASLLGQIFRLMGLPAESLEFLTRGAKFSKPPLSSTLKNVPGLLRLLGRELSLVRDFQRDERQYFRPGLAQLDRRSLPEFSTEELLERIDAILALLKRATYYSILAPLSASLRQAVFRVQDDKIDNSQTPEVAALREIAALAKRAREIVPQLSPEQAFEQLPATAPGREILQQFEQILDRYGYLSQVGTDIAVPTWKEEPQVVRELFVQMLSLEASDRSLSKNHLEKRHAPSRVQQRIDLKGQVTQVYSRLLAELRWCCVRLEEVLLQSGQLSQTGDIFFLEFDEVRQVVAGDMEFRSQLKQTVEMRRSQFAQDSQLNPIPALIYGNSPPTLRAHSRAPLTTPDSLFKGIGASSGQVTGTIKVLHNWQMLPEIDQETILVVPYTDSGWVAAISRAGGLIAEVGGRLSHGAIVAREYGIPAVMDVRDATHLFRDGQRVRLDGQQGTIEIL
jgi:phosphoenolpyruvate synthase/pyruvate phosphate dikinase/glycerol-3-phosphate acyltransferase PlsY